MIGGEYSLESEVALLEWKLKVSHKLMPFIKNTEKSDTILLFIHYHILEISFRKFLVFSMIPFITYSPILSFCLMHRVCSAIHV